ncbi:bifunctional UDP-N-acetylglucosamine diphosphorylase/glucosamine-1-phosphate N-acetyltransferase GlmU [Parvularcula maris]|uniref:Bifunctional protein GlmU n=1 Tax=Parvularcula maris TaxID=2965077 RepID=A0A9X2L7Z0_9PROT|nr:bifunctional UDP-N-acetylglucosamine diphosphorylase/glucosamine-1-phosphate N-acetyltransferase GlmU [Parvularcula maris]MCQ8184616.1 bifunctional UDP-N-acetylglucosamine diphosphorylase/glucosamine-1-phosphate N-acetyltransferase GlmU [Parvularcula maris]
MSALAVIVLAAGHGSRMRSETPKVLHKIAHLPMLGHCLRVARRLDAERLGVVIGAGGEKVRTALPALDERAEIAVQDPPQGTGDAVRQAMPLLDGFEGTVLVLYGDTPLLTEETLRRMTRRIEDGAGLVVLGFEPQDPGPYGRLITNEAGELQHIREAKDASPEELAVRLCNSGVMAFDSNYLASELPKLQNDNANEEYYLTDLAGLIREAGGRVLVETAPEDEVLGVNNRVELAEAERIFQDRRRRELMEAGVTMSDPRSVYLAYDTEIAPDCVIGQNVVFGPGVRLERGVEVKPFSHLEGAVMEEASAAGPFARLRQGTKLGPKSAIGNFVETKKAVLGEGVKAGHLTYLGDVEIGAGTNVGAGTITCNYDGYGKYKTTIGANCFIGSSTMLVAPVTIADGGFTGSGSVITRNVEADALGVARGKQRNIEGWAAAFRQKNGK